MLSTELLTKLVNKKRLSHETSGQRTQSLAEVYMNWTGQAISVTVCYYRA